MDDDFIKQREDLFRELCELLDKKTALKLITRVDSIVVQAVKDFEESEEFKKFFS